jgi:hypothetical protein
LPLEGPQPQLRVPELELSVAIRLFKDRYGIFQEPVEGRPYYLRFKELATGKEIQGMTHSKGTAISPRFILEILGRFDIKIPDFLEDLAAIKKGPQPV